MRRARSRRSGQAVLEFALMYAGVLLPLTFMLIFGCQILWIWHSVCDFTRDGARYAATHCWMADGSNVVTYMEANVPAMIDQNQFQTGAAGITVSYFQQDLTSGSLQPFACASAECSAGCVPDAVSVSVSNYQFTRFSGFFKLPPVTIPPFTFSLPMESAGFDSTGQPVGQ
jgi:hypothetical protein